MKWALPRTSWYLTWSKLENALLHSTKKFKCFSKSIPKSIYQKMSVFPTKNYIRICQKKKNFFIILHFPPKFWIRNFYLWDKSSNKSWYLTNFIKETQSINGIMNIFSNSKHCINYNWICCCILESIINL